SELRLRGFQLLQLDDLAGLGARRTRQALGHRAIVQSTAAMPPAKPGRSTRAARRSSSNAPPQRSVLFIGSEALPFAKTGGLADVLGALPVALGRIGWDVTVALPRYRGVTAGEQVGRFTLSVGGYYSNVGFFAAPLGERTRALLVDDPALFDREQLYG